MEMYIGGKFCGAENGETIGITDPATMQEIGRMPMASVADVDRAVSAADAAFEGWRKMPAHDRALVMQEMARKLNAHKQTYAALLTAEQGDTLSTHLHDEIEFCISTIDFYAQLSREEIGSVVPPNTSHTFNFVLKEPYGPTACIVPFNYPFLLLFWKIAPALAAGNTIVIKPSERTPLATLQLAKDVFDHFPPGVVNVISGTGATGQALVGHPRIRIISFTGSTKVGEKIIRDSVGTGKNLIIEMGGKDATVVADDIDLDQAVSSVLASSFWNAGQVCTSTERVYVQRAVYDAFLKKMIAGAERLKLGDGRDETTDIGPLCDNATILKVEEHIADAVAKGAVVRTGGKRRKGLPSTQYFEPTILTGVSDDMLCVQDETFGPVVFVEPYDTMEDAIALVNSSRFGLGAILLSMNPIYIKQFFEDVKAGTIWINDPLPDTMGGPFGGMKCSGYCNSRELGRQGLEQYLETKHVHWDFAPDRLHERTSF